MIGFPILGASALRSKRATIRLGWRAGIAPDASEGRPPISPRTRNPGGTPPNAFVPDRLASELVNFSVTPAGVGASECLAVVAAR
jgi:hypothetical protein